MSYQPQFTITPALLAKVEQIAHYANAFRPPRAGAVDSALQKDTARATPIVNSYRSNPLTLEEVRAVEKGGYPDIAARAKREVTNYFADLRFIETKANIPGITHEDIFTLHRFLRKVMIKALPDATDNAGRVGGYVPPRLKDVSGLMFELLTWWNKESVKLSPVLSSAILPTALSHPPFAMQRRSRAGPGFVDYTGAGSIPTHFFRGRVLLGRPPALLSIAGCRAQAEDLPAGWNTLPKDCL